MVVVECSVPDCTLQTNDVSEALAIALLANHGLAHQHAPAVMAAAAQVPALQGPKADRLGVNVGVSIHGGYMVYVSHSVQAMYLSYESLLYLGLLPKDFPSGNISKGLEDERGPDISHMPGHPLSVSAIRSTSGSCTDQNDCHGS